MSYLMYSDLIFISTEIAELARKGNTKQAVNKLNELSPLQAVYTFSFVEKTLGTNSNDLKLLIDAIEREMNMEES